MGAPYNNIDIKVEAALKEVITEAITAGTTLTDYGVIRTGIDSLDKEENCIVCYVDSAAELVGRRGVWNVSCMVTVYTNMDGTGGLANHKANVATIRDLFMDDALHTTITATDENLLASGVVSYSITNDVEDRCAAGGLRFNLIASAT